jgi:hypothetical protein
MAKETGLGDLLFIGGVDVSGDIGSLGRIGGGNEPLPLTGINKSAKERAGGLRDGSLEYSAWFNTTGIHATLSALPTTDQITTYVRGSSIGTPAASLIGKQLNYDAERGDDGSLVFSVNAVANSFGLLWGQSMTAGIRTDGSATAGTAVDNTDATAFGLALFVHLLAFTGTSVTVKVQESSDNAGDAYADVVGATSGALTTIGAVSAFTSLTLAVERYLKITTVGTFSNAVFITNVVRFPTAVAF